MMRGGWGWQGGGGLAAGFRRKADNHFAVHTLVDAALERPLIDGPDDVVTWMRARDKGWDEHILAALAVSADSRVARSWRAAKHAARGAGSGGCGWQ